MSMVLFNQQMIIILFVLLIGLFTDIALSNLHRQFLYHEEHIGKQKSETAALAISKFNPQLHMKAYNVLVSQESLETLGGDSFFEDLDVILSAVDSVEARLFLDSLAVYNSIPFLGIPCPLFSFLFPSTFPPHLFVDSFLLYRLWNKWIIRIYSSCIAKHHR